MSRNRKASPKGKAKPSTISGCKKSTSEESKSRGNEAQNSSSETKEEKERPDVDKEGGKRPGSNDPEWYSRDPRLLMDCASIPYSEPFGSRITLKSDIDTWGGHTPIANQTIADTSVSTPGILVATIEPAYGEASNRLSPANVAATALYSHVRYVNNGRKNYDPADLFMYVSSVAELYSFLNYVRRIYGSALIYSQVNRYIGKALLKAQGVDPDSVVNNLANVRYWINVFTNKISSYAVPADITLFYKRAFQFSSIYIEHEGDSVKDQLYMYRPRAFYRFRLDSRKLGMLERVELSILGTTKTWDEITQFGENLLEYIFGDEDFGLMSGDVMRAFNGKILSLESLPEDYTAFIKFDPYVLHQFENATISATQTPPYKDSSELGETDAYYQMIGDPDMYKYQFGHVYQDGLGNLISQHALLQGTGMATGPNNALVPLFDKLISIHAGSGDIGLTIESIQNMAPYYDNNNVYIHAGPSAMDEALVLIFPGSAYVSQVGVYYYDANDTLQLKVINQATPCEYGGTEYVLDQTKWDFKYLSFKYAPKIYEYAVSESAGIVEFNVLSNVDTYAIVSNRQVRRMLEVSLLSLLYVPGVAKLTNALGENKNK